MAFKNQQQLSSGQSNNENWKAQAFINVFVTFGEGNRRKLIGIPLKESKAFERMLIERLQQEGGLEAFAENVSFTFELADKEVKASDLGW